MHTSIPNAQVSRAGLSVRLGFEFFLGRDARFWGEMPPDRGAGVFSAYKAGRCILLVVYVIIFLFI
jgi:hypothetical protein